MRMGHSCDGLNILSDCGICEAIAPNGVLFCPWRGTHGNDKGAHVDVLLRLGGLEDVPDKVADGLLRSRRRPVEGHRGRNNSREDGETQHETHAVRGSGPHGQRGTARCSERAGGGRRGAPEGDPHAPETMRRPWGLPRAETRKK